MKELIKAYYEYLLANDPQFVQFVKETEGLTTKEIATKYNVEINQGD